MKEYCELVSVIVPVYNVEKYLNKCVKSILAQSYEMLEIILVDDGSNDASGRLCDEWAEKDDRILVVHKANGGLSDARNAGLDIARGKYFAFIDSDDYIAVDMIETLVMSAKANSCEIAICNMIRFSENGNIAPFYCPADNETVLLGNHRFETLKQPSVCNKLFLAKLFEGIRFPKGKYYEDTFVYHELVYRSKNVVLTGKDGYWYLLREDSIVGRPQYTDRYFDFVEAVWKRAKFLLDHEVQPYGDEACLSLYAALTNAEKYIIKTENNRMLFKKAYQYYQLAYENLMEHRNGIGFKQKIRLTLLKYCPSLHSKIY